MNETARRLLHFAEKKESVVSFCPFLRTADVESARVQWGQTPSVPTGFRSNIALTEAGVRRHRELTPWRHEELTPSVPLSAMRRLWQQFG